ncbi:phage tail protein [Pseudomonas sp. BW16M2]|uniref:phage tail assembly chaperone n=1 Tax=Pseudomonas sp. BW16M2 TaxID=2745489 RepID=UPI001648C09E|nr:phage tail assembly chaperone [Pseudomonas sp. BW16M2]MBC3436058.1 phage tail protein [Pseudomonas sp. BW16M2]
MKFSISTGCFYDGRIHKDIPKDAVDVTDEQFQELSSGRNTGKQIIVRGGRLVLVDPEPVVLSREEAEARERVWRDQEVTRAAWVRDRHRDELELGLIPTLSADRASEVLVYLQQLRDWPQAELFPQVSGRPIAPPWLTATP